MYTFMLLRRASAKQSCCALNKKKSKLPETPPYCSPFLRIGRGSQLFPHKRSLVLPHKRSLVLQHKRSLVLQHKISLVWQHKRSLVLPHKRSLMLQHKRSLGWQHKRSLVLPCSPVNFRLSSESRGAVSTPGLPMWRACEMDGRKNKVGTGVWG